MHVYHIFRMIAQCLRDLIILFNPFIISVKTHNNRNVSVKREEAAGVFFLRVAVHGTGP